MTGFCPSRPDTCTQQRSNLLTRQNRSSIPQNGLGVGAWASCGTKSALQPQTSTMGSFLGRSPRNHGVRFSRTHDSQSSPTLHPAPYTYPTTFNKATTRVKSRLNYVDAAQALRHGVEKTHPHSRPGVRLAPPAASSRGGGRGVYMSGGILPDVRLLRALFRGGSSKSAGKVREWREHVARATILNTL